MAHSFYSFYFTIISTNNSLTINPLYLKSSQWISKLINCHFPGKPDPFIDFALDLSFGLPHLGYVYNGFHLRGPQSSVSGYPGPGHLANRDLTEAELVSDGNTVRPAFVPADSVSPVTSSCSPRAAPPQHHLLFQIEKFRLGVRSYLDPIVDPMVNPIKRFFKADSGADHVSTELKEMPHSHTNTRCDQAPCFVIVGASNDCHHVTVPQCRMLAMFPD